uniref:Proteasome activator complex subunit 3 n=2 Tax=Timema TaxID=61471 RepID=A0A7R9DIW4_TIMPO|nr:unnamed protein product [Timema douglasi]CAD7415588.1 unnamed protein product [Timema poppensis]
MANISKSSEIIQGYKDTLKRQVEELLLREIPRKVVELNVLLENTNKFKEMNHLDVIRSPQYSVVTKEQGGEPTKKRQKKSKYNYDEEIIKNQVVVTNITFPSNKELSELISVVEPFIRQLIEDTNTLKMWISSIPRIEDGDHFEGTLQENAIGQIMMVLSEAKKFLCQISVYFEARGKIVSKVLKYPGVEDYMRAVSKLDKEERVNLWLVVCAIRNHYYSLYDYLVKYWE